MAAKAVSANPEPANDRTSHETQNPKVSPQGGVGPKGRAAHGSDHVQNDGDANVAVEGKWLNVPLLCTSCGIERGRLSYETLKFIRRVVETFGRPTEPIKLKKTDLSKQFPHDAGVAEVDLGKLGLKEPNNHE